MYIFILFDFGFGNEFHLYFVLLLLLKCTFEMYIMCLKFNINLY